MNEAAPGDYQLRRLRLLFYLAMPFAVAFLLGWIQVGRTADWPKHISLLYWFGHIYVSLLFLEVGTQPIANLLRPRGVPLWVTLIIAQLIIARLAILPFSRLYTEWVHTFLPVELVGALQSYALAEVLQRLPSNLVGWVGINLLFFYLLGMPRFGYVPPNAAARSANVTREWSGADDEAKARSQGDAFAAQQPVFMTHVRPDRVGNLLALRADGHYVHVYTDAGCDMILYRLRDAIAELGNAQGLRVHRSWWVADCAIAAGGASIERLNLVNGLEVPVSRANRSRVKRRWLET